jgi:hypothetical protein
MRTWTATTVTAARPADVLDVLTDPEACRRWAPVPFELEGLGSSRLRAGAHARVSGRLAGRTVGFDVEIREADEQRVSLAATGPVGFDVEYALEAAEVGSHVHASVSVRPAGGLTGRLLAQATSALLSAGALQTAVHRIGREAAAVC